MESTKCMGAGAKTKSELLALQNAERVKARRAEELSAARAHNRAVQAAGKQLWLDESAVDDPTLMIGRGRAFVISDAPHMIKKLRNILLSSGSHEKHTKYMITPDGRHIVFVSSRGGRSELYIMPSDGRSQRSLGSKSRGLKTPSWGR